MSGAAEDLPKRAVVVRGEADLVPFYTVRSAAHPPFAGVPRGERLLLLSDTSDGWSHVLWRGCEGYMRSNLVAPSPEAGLFPVEVTKHPHASFYTSEAASLLGAPTHRIPHLERLTIATPPPDGHLFTPVSWRGLQGFIHVNDVAPAEEETRVVSWREKVTMDPKDLVYGVRRLPPHQKKSLVAGVAGMRRHLSNDILLSICTWLLPRNVKLAKKYMLKGDGGTIDLALFHIKATDAVGATLTYTDNDGASSSAKGKGKYDAFKQEISLMVEASEDAVIPRQPVTISFVASKGPKGSKALSLALSLDHMDARHFLSDTLDEF